MPVRVRVLCLLAVTTVLVVAILAKVPPEVITLLAAALAAIAPAVFGRSGGGRSDRGPR